MSASLPVSGSNFDLRVHARLWLQTLHRVQRGHCACCGTPTNLTARRSDKELMPDDATLEHIRARAKHGPDTQDNLMLTCHRCNAEKGQTDVVLFMHTKAGCLSGDAKRAVLETHRLLCEHFEAFKQPGKYGPVNAYVGMNMALTLGIQQTRQPEPVMHHSAARPLARSTPRVQPSQAKPLLSLKPAASVPPAPAAEAPATPAIAALPAPVESTMVAVVEASSPTPEPEDEVAECNRMTVELQQDIAHTEPEWADTFMYLGELAIQIKDDGLFKEMAEALSRAIALAQTSSLAITNASAREELLRDQGCDDTFVAEWFPATLSHEGKWEKDRLVAAKLRMARLMATANQTRRQWLYNTGASVLYPEKTPRILHVMLNDVIRSVLSMHVKLDYYRTTFPKGKCWEP